MEGRTEKTCVGSSESFVTDAHDQPTGDRRNQEPFQLEILTTTVGRKRGRWRLRHRHMPLTDVDRCWGGAPATLRKQSQCQWKLRKWKPPTVSCYFSTPTPTNDFFFTSRSPQTYVAEGGFIEDEGSALLLSARALRFFPPTQPWRLRHRHMPLTDVDRCWGGAPATLRKQSQCQWKLRKWKPPTVSCYFSTPTPTNDFFFTSRSPQTYVAEGGFIEDEGSALLLSARALRFAEWTG